MFDQYVRRPALVVSMTGLLVAGLTLAACAGSTAPPTTEAPAATSQSEATATLAMTAEPTAAPTTETSAAIDTPAAAPTTAAKPTCQPVDKNDQLGQVFDYLNGYIENTKPVDAVATISDTDWTRGPATASITVIEYGDFQ